MALANINPNESELMIKGSYDYKFEDNIYCQERFEVIRHLTELTTEFVAESLARVSTGEMLKIKTRYSIGKDWIPRHVMIDKSLGMNHIIETFECNQRTNRLVYSFLDINNETTEQYETSTPPRFHITTPTVVSNFLFILSKKFDNTGDNNYGLIGSGNRWDFAPELLHQSITLRKLDKRDDNIQIAGTEYQGTWYKLRKLENSDEFSAANIDSAEKEFVEVMLSKFISIPFKINQPDGTSIKVSSFTNLVDNF